MEPTINNLNNIMKYLLLMLAAALGMVCHADNAVRRDILLDGGWTIKPISDTNRKAPAAPVSLPHTWNAAYLPGTHSYNRETMVYQRTLNICSTCRASASSCISRA